MSKKHYKAIAAIIRRRFAIDEEWRKLGDMQIRLFVGELMDYMATDNSNFDYGKFSEACGF